MDSVHILGYLIKIMKWKLRMYTDTIQVLIHHAPWEEKKYDL